MARRNMLLQYAIIGTLGYALWKLVGPTITGKRVSAGASPATNTGGGTGGGVPGSPNQVLSPEQEMATAISHGWTLGV